MQTLDKRTDEAMPQTIADYLTQLSRKGFRLGEDAEGFIEFGKQYAGADEQQVIAAIEITLKAQKSFDGAFYISLLERLVKENIKNRTEAMKKAQHLQLL
ncbi:DUF6123 family protein [Metabacillus sp. GX 13764]|uniref:DUF6123 family protein n=1 Tax=Metabacillus kandeliae TaxID=2900151 RepID=UPI001E34C352|nr:DUF6123 family protein [Metabacillus kandeliae]MCD7033434.1 DUF6123 family protein [Metabacillus kandeliae]